MMTEFRERHYNRHIHLERRILFCDKKTMKNPEKPNVMTIFKNPQMQICANLSGHFGPETVRHCSGGSEVSGHFGTVSQATVTFIT